MRHRTGKMHWTIGLLAVAAVVAAVVVVRMNRGPQPTPPNPPRPEPTEIPPPALAETPYLNAGTDAHHVGSGACTKCHTGHHKSYLLTPHSRALSDLNPKIEPPDAAFEHKASGRTYRVYRRGEQFRHEEVLTAEDGRVVARVDQPIKFLIGSGHFCRSYLFEADGFLHESPLTWYTSRRTWDMSPGYDQKAHYSFERPVTAACLGCHAGRVEPDGKAVHRARIHEQAIGCESCHGPGSVHVAAREAGRPAGDDDRTIVNPGKLSRPLLESVCAACHLNGPAVVAVRGRKAADFRPGRPLTDYRVDYRHASGSEQMTVVGHIEQLRRSACYERSAMTCLTCHDPHAAELPKNPVAFYRQKCLDCHAENGCKLPEPERRKKDAADNCATCHMPRGDTDIPHIAFTHHRIGRHPAAAPPDSWRLPELVPTDDVSRLSAADQGRNLGLAYLILSESVASPSSSREYRERARQRLEAAVAANLHDGPTLAGLARACWADREVGRATDLAEQALRSPELEGVERAQTCAVLAGCYMADRQYGRALEVLTELTKLRRLASDWRTLGACYLELGRASDARAALKYALAIRPTRPDVHALLADVYERLGDAAKARHHRTTAEWLEKHRQE